MCQYPFEDERKRGRVKLPFGARLRIYVRSFMKREIGRDVWFGASGRRFVFGGLIALFRFER
jgi:hypothetical protein